MFYLLWFQAYPTTPSHQLTSLYSKKTFSEVSVVELRWSRNNRKKFTWWSAKSDQLTHYRSPLTNFAVGSVNNQGSQAIHAMAQFLFLLSRLIWVLARNTCHTIHYFTLQFKRFAWLNIAFLHSSHCKFCVWLHNHHYLLICSCNQRFGLYFPTSPSNPIMWRYTNGKRYAKRNIV